VKPSFRCDPIRLLPISIIALDTRPYMDSARMVAAHGDGHAAYATGERSLAQKAGTVQRFDTGAFVNSELT